MVVSDSEPPYGASGKVHTPGPAFKRRHIRPQSGKICMSIRVGCGRGASDTVGAVSQVEGRVVCRNVVNGVSCVTRRVSACRRAKSDTLCHCGRWGVSSVSLGQTVGGLWDNTQLPAADTVDL